MVANCCIAGVGSPHGDDQIGWRIVDILQKQQLPAQVVRVRDPMGLLDCCDGCQQLVIVDACSTGALPGTISRLEWPDSRIKTRHRFSTHGISVAGVLELAGNLGRLPERAILFGVEVSRCLPGDEMSRPVAEALVELETRICQEIT